MGFTTDRVPGPYALSDICSVTYREFATKSLPLIFQDQGGKFVYGEEVPCQVGFVQKSLGGVTWFRNEIDIDRPQFSDWKPAHFRPGHLVRRDGEFLQAHSEHSSSESCADQWHPVRKRPHLIICQRPRQSQSKIVLFPFRVGVKRSKRDRDRRVQAWKETLYQTLPKGLTIQQLLTLAKAHVIERYECEQRDWSYGDDQQLRAGFHLPIEDAEVRRNYAGVVMGMIFLRQSEETPSEALDSIVASILGSDEIVRELALATESCIPTQPPDIRNQYRFWPRCVPGKPTWTLFEGQYHAIDEQMSIAIKQALCGPDSSDIAPTDNDFWTGRPVSTLAKIIFRTRMFWQWKQLSKERRVTLPPYIVSLDEADLGYQQFV